jgi:hypothetical protein
MRWLTTFLLLFACTTRAQIITYNGNTNTSSVISYPGTIPCPGSSCPSGYATSGANTIITPSDFNNSILRVTDNNTWGVQADSYHVTFAGDAYVLPFNINDNRFVVYETGNLIIPFSLNPSTLQATKLYGSNYYMNNPQPYSSITFSYTQPYIGYALAFTGGGDPAIYSYDFTSTSSAPTGVLVQDLATCAPALASLGYESADDLTVSHDDQTFAIVLSTTSGQGSSGMVWIVVWNRTNGCRVYETDNGAVTGAWGSTGTINMSDRFTVHDADINPGGNIVYFQYATCLSANCNTIANSTYPSIQGGFWNISTLNVTGNTSLDSCDHTGLGYSVAVNACVYGAPYDLVWFSRPYSSPQTTPPTGALNTNANTGGFDQHSAWSTDNSSDTQPFCATTNNIATFAPNNPYDNEIDCVQTNNAPNGTIWRMSHTYSSAVGVAGYYAGEALGGMSADGKFYIWTSDWNQMLGPSGSGRTDVFITSLPQLTGSTPQQLSGGTKISGGVKIQ